MITSASPGEGKTTTTANLAAVFAEAGSSVLVVNCDFRRPTIHRYFGVEDEPRRVHETGIGGVKIVTNVLSDPRSNPAQVVAAQRQVVAAARGRFDVILLDTAPLLTANDAVELVSSADMLRARGAGRRQRTSTRPSAASSCSTGSTSRSPASCWSAPSARRTTTTTTTNRVGSSRPAAVLRRRAVGRVRTATGHTVSTSTCSCRSPGRRRRLVRLNRVAGDLRGTAAPATPTRAGRSPPRSRGGRSRRSRSGRSRRRRWTRREGRSDDDPDGAAPASRRSVSSGRRGPASPPRRTSSFSVKVLTNARGSRSTISCTWRRSSPRTRSALRTASDASGVLRWVTRSAPDAARRVDGRCGGGHARAPPGRRRRPPRPGANAPRRATAGAPPSMGNGTGSRCRPRGCGGGPPLRRAYRGVAAQSPETRRSQRFWLPASGVM